MGLTTKFLIALSAMLLTHSCYSAHEHSSLSSTTATTASTTATFSASSSSFSFSSSSASPSSLPLDITLETVVAALLLTLGIVLSTDRFRPISLRVWAGRLEREKGCGPFNALEERLGFLDIRARREEFAEWTRRGEGEGEGKGKGKGKGGS